MYYHSISNEGIKTPPTNETWPVGYKFQANNGKYYSLRCFGTLKAVLSQECCAYPLVQNGAPQFITQAGNYRSMSTVLVQDSPLVASPYLGTDAQYCSLGATTSNSLKGYTSAYYLADGNCTPAENVICFPNATLNIYSSPGCNGTAQTFDLSSPTTLTTSTLNTVTGQFIGVPAGTGSSKISYTIMISTNQFIPDFTFWGDYMTIFMPLVALVCVLFTLYVHGIKLLKQRKLYLIVNFITQVIFLFFILVAFFASMGYYSKLIDGLHYTSMMIATILSVCQSFKIVFSVQKVHIGIEYGTYFLVAAVNVCLCWNQYTRFFVVVPGVTFNQQLVATISATNLTWNLLYYIIDCVPPIFIIYRLIKGSPDYNQFTDIFKILWAVDKYFLINFICQFVMFGFYILQDRIKASTEWLRDDRVWLGFLNAESLAFGVHASLTALLFERMSDIIKKNKLFSYQSKTRVGTSGFETKSEVK
ncbi:hypothetical protein HDV04_004987 [Boothiomyces sp. JEL0838]|nr:hypothetical protein HDV04_004987 [Boothiomyces sp. JEL0838]